MRLRHYFRNNYYQDWKTYKEIIKYMNYQVYDSKYKVHIKINLFEKEQDSLNLIK